MLTRALVSGLAAGLAAVLMLAAGQQAALAGGGPGGGNLVGSVTCGQSYSPQCDVTGRPPVAAAGAGRPRRDRRGIGPAHPGRPAPSEAAYTREEFGQIKAAAARTFGAALVRIRTGQEQLLRWQSGDFPRPGLREQYRQTQPGTAGYLTGEALDVLQHTGDVPLTRAGHRAVTARHARALGGTGPEHTWAKLFLTMPEAAALAVLLVCDQGWNRSVLDVMTVPDTPGAGEHGLDIYRAGIVKRRRPARARYSSANLPDTGPGSPGRLIRQAIEATEPARIALAAPGTPTDRLVVSRRDQFRGRLDMFCLGAPPGDSMRRWASGAGLAGPDGEPLQVSLRRLRRTVQVLIRREPAQNSQQVHESAYVLRDPATLP